MNADRTVLVGREIPDFTAPAVMPNNEIIETFNIKEHLKGSYGVIFFYPLDFTFVCPSEILAHAHRLQDFQTRHIEIVGISVDSHFTHLAWKNTPVEKGGIGKIQFPLVADLTKVISRLFGVLVDESVALRGTFLIDRSGIVRHQVVNDLPLGRNVDDVLRVADALQFHEEHGEVCPAGWQKGKPGMQATPSGVAAYLAQHADTL
ncbi:Alkyl hydroperoxide reductase subunit C-like protein [invertebrate metagenome]|uniref:Alkyl hydroperoxide reductase subunit C-like protein n=1 Tax=invertebrate metagenome TaxID=1711999 RepID=A0A484H5I4_9ZZZZ